MYESYEKQGKTEKLSPIREGRERRQLNATWLPGLESEEKDIKGKADEIQINLKFVKSNLSTSVA